MNCVDPDISRITKEEIRPFLNAQFLFCRALSKVIATPDYYPGDEKAYFIAKCLKGYQFIIKISSEIASQMNVDINDYFGDEINIVKEMVNLLPGKIDKMHYKGEDGFSL